MTPQFDMPGTAPCWNCKKSNIIEVLKGVRFAKCSCGALFPGYSTASFRQNSRALGLSDRERIILEL